jgi:hypothetical protein
MKIKAAADRPSRLLSELPITRIHFTNAPARITTGCSKLPTLDEGSASTSWKQE